MPAPRTSTFPAQNPSASRKQRSRSRRPAKAQPAASVRPVASRLEADLDSASRCAPPAATTFAALGLPAPLVAMLAKRGIGAPFAIQTRAIPDVLAGRDVLGRAQTGGGKTLAFGLPMLARLAASGTTRRPNSPRGLVLVPTRELATQVADVLRPLGEAVGLKLVCIFGGSPYGKQIDALRRGVDLVVATPGRLVDLIERGSCSLGAVEIAVLDEADHMADLGFLPAVRGLLDQTPAGGQRLLFSATLDRGVDKLVRAYLEDPALHAVAAAAAPVDAMDHRVFVLHPTDKVAVVAEVASRPARTLIFVRTKHGADRLVKQLVKGGVDAAAIHGNLKQNARQRALDGFAAGRPRVLVATDVAARGIHVDDVDLVVHFDPPNDAKDYLHRSGRTARAGASGTALSLVLPGESSSVAAMHKGAGVAPVAVDVRPGHPAVRELATSGEPATSGPPTAIAERTVAVHDQRRPRSHTGGRPGYGPNRRPGNRTTGRPARRPDRPSQPEAQRRGA